MMFTVSKYQCFYNSIIKYSYSGVVLFNLARLRTDKEFCSMLEPEQVANNLQTENHPIQIDPSFEQVFSLIEEYGFMLSLGDQVIFASSSETT